MMLKCNLSESFRLLNVQFSNPVYLAYWECTNIACLGISTSTDWGRNIKAYYHYLYEVNKQKVKRNTREYNNHYFLSE